MERFTDLEIDAADAAPAHVQLPSQEEQTRWSEPEVGTGPAPEPEPTTRACMDDYLLGDGPASRTLVAANLHHKIVLEPLGLASGRNCAGIDRYFAVVNSGNNTMLGRPVTARYKICQNATLARMLDAIVSPEAPVSIKSLRNGERLVFRVGLGDQISDAQREYIEHHRHHFNKKVHNWQEKPDFVPPKTNELIVVNSHGTTGKLLGRHRITFLACDNGIVMTKSQCGFSWSHHAYLDERIERARQAFEFAAEDAHRSNELFGAMFGTKIKAREFDSFCDHLFPETEKIQKKEKARHHWELRRAGLRKCYLEVPGSEPGTVHGLMMAATYYNSHSRKLYGEEQTQQEKRFELSIEGDGQRLNDRALQYCTQLLH